MDNLRYLKLLLMLRRYSLDSRQVSSTSSPVVVEPLTQVVVPFSPAPSSCDGGLTKTCGVVPTKGDVELVGCDTASLL